MRLEDPEALYLGTDDLPVTTAEVVAWMAEVLGVGAPPPGDARSLNKRCRNARLRQSGYAFTYPTFREGYREIVRAFLEQAAER